jgi:hypothetical protein
MAGARESLNLRYRAPNVVWFLPTQSRHRGETVFLTYGNGDGRAKADDGEAARVNLHNGVGVLWWSSGPGDGSSDD